jgi:hypothetical protein
VKRLNCTEIRVVFQFIKIKGRADSDVLQGEIVLVDENLANLIEVIRVFPLFRSRRTR